MIPEETAMPPTLAIPREFHDAVANELRRRMRQRLEALGLEAIDTVAQVMREGEGEQYDQYSRAGTGRLKAAQEVLNRVIGKVPDKVEARVELSPWEQMQGGADLVIDVEVLDEAPAVQPGPSNDGRQLPGRTRGRRTGS